MSDSIYIVHEGDHLSLIAHRLGVDADELWKNPKHDRLRKAGRTPDLLCTGDVLHYTPPLRKWHAVKIGQVNKFTVEIPKVKVTLIFKGIANAKCTVKQLPEGKNEFTTDGDGKLEFMASIREQVFDIVFPDHSSHQVRVGHLDPMSEPSGQAQRLANLGYLRGDRTLEDAVSAYQADQKLTVTGQIDGATLKHLEDAHAAV